MDKKMLGDTIQTGRKAAGLTQHELAKNAVLSRSYLADIESGRYFPSTPVLVRIAKCINLDLNTLK